MFLFLVFLETNPRLLTKHSTTQELYHQCRVAASPVCWLVYLDRFWCSPGWNLQSQKWPWTSGSCLYLPKCWDFRDVLPCLIWGPGDQLRASFILGTHSTKLLHSQLPSRLILGEPQPSLNGWAISPASWSFEILCLSCLYSFWFSWVVSSVH